jgi:hypothetical protein
MGAGVNCSDELISAAPLARPFCCTGTGALRDGIAGLGTGTVPEPAAETAALRENAWVTKLERCFRSGSDAAGWNNRNFTEGNEANEGGGGTKEGNMVAGLGTGTVPEPAAETAALRECLGCEVFQAESSMLHFH